MEKESGDTDSSDSEVKVPVKKRRILVSDESDDDEFEIQFESEVGGSDRGGSDRGDSEDDTSGSGGGERVEYVSDVNHNTEKIVLKLRKK